MQDEEKSIEQLEDEIERLKKIIEDQARLIQAYINQAELISANQELLNEKLQRHMSEREREVKWDREFYMMAASKNEEIKEASRFCLKRFRSDSNEGFQPLEAEEPDDAG